MKTLLCALPLFIAPFGCTLPEADKADTGNAEDPSLNSDADADADADTDPDADGDGVPASTDCDDNDSALGSTATDADCDGTLTADDCDDSDPAVAVVCLTGEQTYSGEFTFYIYMEAFGEYPCEGSLNMTLLYPTEADETPSVISGSSECTAEFYGTAIPFDLTDSEFTSFFSVAGVESSVPDCEMPWAGELSADGGNVSGSSDTVECSLPGFPDLFGTPTMSFEFSADLVSR